jgi:hypothetical protein
MNTINDFTRLIKKALDNDELLKLKGGTDGTMCIYCVENYEVVGTLYTICGIDWETGITMCKGFYGSGIDDTYGTCGQNCLP